MCLFLKGLLWNYFNSWGPMCADCQNVAGSCRFYFVSYWFVALQCEAICITLLNVRGDANSWVTLTHEIHDHQTPTNNDDSTVVVKITNVLRTLFFLKLLPGEK